MQEKRRVGIWLRVSTGFQVESESPEHHEQRARYYAQAKDWEVVEVYRLDAFSGKSISDHPETKRMYRDVQNGHITALIFSKVARVARNTRELLDFSDFFRRVGADMVSLSENIDTSTPAGRLFYTIIAAMATWEREEIAERVAASVPVRAKMGKPLGGAAPFGFRWEGKELQVCEEEAPVRRLMYELFLKHKRKKSTAAELNALGYRTRNGSKFSDTTVERLLRDSSAKGVRRANYTKSTGDGKKWVIKDEKDWVYTPCPVIVSEDLWNECNAVLEAQYKKRTKPGPKSMYLLAGYVTCHCGKKMYVYHTKPTYRCRKCNNNILVSDIDEIYHGQLKSFLLTDTDISTYMEQSDSLIANKLQLQKSVETEIGSLRKELQEFIQMRIRKELTQERFKEIYDPLEEKLGQLERQYPSLQAEIDFLKIQHASSDVILQDAKDLYDRWTTLPFEEKRAIVELITETLIIDKQEITIKLSYLPTTHPSQNPGKEQRNFMGS